MAWNERNIGRGLKSVFRRDLSGLCGMGWDEKRYGTVNVLSIGEGCLLFFVEGIK